MNLESTQSNRDLSRAESSCPSGNMASLPAQLGHFILHLRWHYQLFILSGGFLLGGFLSSDLNWPSFLLQFANVHLLLFGGATAYNSCCDNDRGPVGGLKHPPPVTGWMRIASVLLQAAGIPVAWAAGSLFTGVYMVSMLFFWLYSSPLTRWKGSPVKSLLAIGISTGTNSLLMGYLAAASGPVTFSVAGGALGVALIVLSLYPVSQMYQLEEDRERGDATFAITFGISGIYRFFTIAYNAGVILLTTAILTGHRWLGLLFFPVAFGTGLLVRYKLNHLGTGPDAYRQVMRIKYGTSLSFLFFLLFVLLIKHTPLGILLDLNMLLE